MHYKLIPGVLGAGEKGIKDESFSTGKLDYPQYTKPVKFKIWTCLKFCFVEIMN